MFGKKKAAPASKDKIHSEAATAPTANTGNADGLDTGTRNGEEAERENRHTAGDTSEKSATSGSLKVEKKGSKGMFALTPLRLAQAGLVAALYVTLCLPFASFSFGLVQFRLAEALTVLPALSAGAVPGLFLGCLLSNILNPNNLGLIDILGGSLATLAAAALTHIFAGSYRKMLSEKWTLHRRKDDEGYIWKMRFLRFVILLPPVVVNAVIVGSYLPYLLLEIKPTPISVIATIGSIFLSQTIVVYTLGLALLLALEKIKLPLEKL